MNLQRIIALVKKDLLKVIRVPAVLFLALLFPIVLTGAFGFAFGSFGGTVSETSYSVGIIDLDDSRWSEYFLNNSIMLNKSKNNSEFNETRQNH